MIILRIFFLFLCLVVISCDGRRTDALTYSDAAVRDGSLRTDGNSGFKWTLRSPEMATIVLGSCRQEELAYQACGDQLLGKKIYISNQLGMELKVFSENESTSPAQGRIAQLRLNDNLIEWRGGRECGNDISKTELVQFYECIKE